MPITEKGKKIMSNMKKTYGEEKGERVFYASENAGTITGVHARSTRAAKAPRRARAAKAAKGKK